MSQGKAPIQTFAFPILELPEIIEQCNTVKLALTLDDLLHPTAVKVQQIYSHWLNFIVHVTLDDIANAVNERLDLLPNPVRLRWLPELTAASSSRLLFVATQDLHREALYVGTFQMTMHQLMFRAAVDNFSVSDLIAPTRDPLVRNISALINFHLFEREQAAEYLEPLLAEDEGLQGRGEELLAANAEAEEKLRLEVDARRNNEPKAAEEQERLHTLRQQLFGMSNIAAEVRKEVERTQEELKDLNAENVCSLTLSVWNVLANVDFMKAEIQKSITNNELELTRLKSQHVQSPDRLRANIQDLSNNIAKEQESVRGLEQKERLLQTKLSALAKYEQDLGGVVKIMDEWEVDVGKLNEANSIYQNYLDEYESLKAEQIEMESNIELLERRITNAKDELSRFGEKSERKRHANKQRKKSLEDYYAQLMEQKATYDMQGAAKNREAVELESQIRSIRDILHQELDRGESEYKKIKDSVKRKGKSLVKVAPFFRTQLRGGGTARQPRAHVIPSSPLYHHLVDNMAREKRASTSKQITYTDDGSDGAYEEEEVPVASTSKAKKRKAPRKSKADSDDEDTSLAVVAKKPKRVAGKGSRTLGRLSAFNDMPMDILAEICSHLEPLALLYMSRTTRSIRQLLTSKNSRSLWIGARENVMLPDLVASDVSEPAYASLVYERNCMVCGKSRAQKVSYTLRARYCQPCQKKTVIVENRVAASVPNMHPKALSCSPYTLSYFFTPEVARISEKLYELEEEHVAIKAARKEAPKANKGKGKGKAKQLVDLDGDQRIEDSEPGETAYKQFICEKRAAVAHAREDGAVLSKWEATSIHDRHTEAEDATRRRKAAITEKMVELGWEPQDLQNMYSSSFSTPEDLTDRIWKKISAEIIGIATRNKTYRLEREARDRRNKRQHLVGARYTILVEQIKPIPNRRFNFPDQHQFCHLVAVKPFWEPEGVVVDDESWTAALPSILAEVSAFEKETKQMYFAQLALNLHNVGAPLDISLITVEKDEAGTSNSYYHAGFKPKISDTITDEAMDEVFARFSSVFVCRTCQSAHSYEEIILHKKTKHLTTRPDSYYAEEERKLIKLRLARLAKEGLDETAKDKELDQAGPIFECHDCSAVKAAQAAQANSWSYGYGYGRAASPMLKTREITWSEAQKHYLVDHVCNFATRYSEGNGEVSIKKITEEVEEKSGDEQQPPAGAASGEGESAEEKPSPADSTVDENVKEEVAEEQQLLVDSAMAQI
ncbi:kinetochore protein Nuf2, partial [Phenoliferia sp. Uapishka_3]